MEKVNTLYCEFRKKEAKRKNKSEKLNMNMETKAAGMIEPKSVEEETICLQTSVPQGASVDASPSVLKKNRPLKEMNLWGSNICNAMITGTTLQFQHSEHFYCAPKAIQVTFYLLAYSSFLHAICSNVKELIFL